MKRTIFFATIIAGILLASCKPGEKEMDSGESYFRHLRFSESPYDQYAGLHEITADEAGDINHYRFSYDNEGRLIELSYGRGDVLLKGSGAGAPLVKIAYVGNREVHNYFNLEGEPVTRSGFYTAEYELDDAGVRKHLRFLDNEGNPVENNNSIAWFDWEILANGQLKENRYNLEGEETVLNEFCPFYELRFSYDENGFLSMMANYQGDTMYNCTVENCGDIGVSYFRFDYNDAGDLTSFNIESLTGQLSNLYWGWARFENKFDDKGNLIDRAMFDQDNEPLGGMSTAVTQTVYDEHGSVIEMKFMNIDRQLVDNPRSGVSVLKYT